MSANDSVYPTNASLTLENNDTSHNTGSQNSDYYLIDKTFLDVLYKVIICGVIPPMVAFGIVGNILALIILLRQKPVRSTTILLIAIAIADLAYLGVTIINVTQLIIRNFFPEIRREVQFKLMIPFAVYIAALPARISNFLVTLITLERLMAVIYPLKVREICTKKLITILTILLSIFASLLQLPKVWLYEVKEVTLPDGNITLTVAFGVLGRQKKLFEIYFIASETLFRYVPICTMIIANSIIIIVIFVQAKWRREKSSDVQKLHNESDEFQITKTLLTITCIFIVCLIPSTVSRMMVLFDPDSTYYKYSSNIYSFLNIIGLVTETLNSSVNFVVYVTMSKTYREEFYKICGRTIKFKQATQSPGPSKEDSMQSRLTAASSVPKVGGESTHM